jgi:adenylate kinase
MAMHVILLGPPGAGKGTQAQMLSERTGMVHVASGDLFRAALRDGTELGNRAKSYMDKGELVPDEIVIDMILERISQPDCANGVLFDGFPRTAEQARALEAALQQRDTSIDAVLYFNVADETLIKRITGRLTCRDCGAVYNIYFNPPKKEGVCDVCGSTDLYHRADDTEETVKNRLSVYHEQTSPLIEYYKKQGRLHEIDGEQDVQDVTNAMMQALGLNGKGQA